MKSKKTPPSVLFSTLEGVFLLPYAIRIII